MTTPRPFAAPAWDNDSKSCAVCSRAFTLMRRQHHCRNCGAAVCNDHSLTNTPIIPLGFDTPVRVCDPCQAKLAAAQQQQHHQQRAAKPAQQPTTPAVPAFGAAEGGDDDDDEPKKVPKKAVVVNCTCGMPLCICAPDAEETDVSGGNQQSGAPTQQQQQQSAPEEKRKPKPAGFNPFSQWSNAASTAGSPNERLRDAIKAGNVSGVEQALAEGADCNFVDDRGDRPLHVAAVMSQSEIVKVLLVAGADISQRNRMGELPTDLAPVSLAAKMTNYAKTKSFA